MEHRFEWDEGNTSHIARHGILDREAEEVIQSDPLVLEVQLRNREQRILCAGRTAGGRALAVVYIRRRGRLRVVTAFPAPRGVKERL